MKINTETLEKGIRVDITSDKSQLSFFQRNNDQYDTRFSMTTKTRYSDKTFKIIDCETAEIATLLSEITNKDTIQSLENDIYIKPDATGTINKLITRIKELEKLLKIS